MSMLRTVMAVLVCALPATVGDTGLRVVDAHADLKISTDRAGHLFSTDEKVRLKVEGAPEGATLKITRSGPGGRSLGDTQVAVTSGMADLGILPAGWYRIRARAGSDEDSVDIGVARPRPEPRFRDSSPFGVVAPPQVAEEWPLMADMGAAWVQWSMTWAYAETKPGLYWYMPGAPKAYAAPDGYVQSANKHGIRTVIQFRTVPRWANGGRIGSYRDGGETRTIMFPPDDDHLDDFGKYVGQVVERFKPLGVKHYEMWAESEGSLFQGWNTPPFPKIEAYQKMVKIARKAIKEKDPQGQLLGPGDSPVKLLHEVEEGYTAPETFNRKPDPYAGSRLAGIGKTFDIVTGHPYWTDFASRPRSHYGPEDRNPGRKPGILKEMIADSREAAGSRPFWITEVGYGSAPSPETPDNVAPDEDGQANLLVRYFLLARAWGAEKIFWYTWKDRTSSGALTSSYGLLRTDGTVKPAYLAYRTMTERLEGREIAMIESGPNRWVLHGKGSRPVSVVWKLRTDSRPETLHVPYARVRVTRRDGETAVVGSADGKVQVQLRPGEPVYLDEAP